MGAPYDDLRPKYFALPRPVGNNSEPSHPGEIWGAFIELAYPAATVLSVAFTDGTVSILRSTGGGFFGGGDERIQAARKSFLEATAAARATYANDERHDPPSTGRAAFFARTDVETLRYEDSLEAINATTHPYHGLYLSGLRILHEYLQLQKRTSAANT